MIVLGNEKGGTGKSTLAMHIVVSLLDQGKTVAVIDLDGRQKTLTRYLENRQQYISSTGCELSCPESTVVPQSAQQDMKLRQQEEQDNLQVALDQYQHEVDYIVLDCPGNDTWLSRLAHAMADTLVTPMNDSFVDLDLLGQVDAEDYQVKQLSHYSEMVWSSRQLRSVGGKPPMDWVVVRNRVVSVHSHNKQRVDAALTALQERIMFRYISGLNDRVVYRELFPKGLTFLDYKKVKEGSKTKMAHVATRYEIQQLVEGLRLPPH